MVRFLAQLTLALISNAVGLFFATMLVDGFSIDTLSFFIAVLIFSLTTTILGPLIIKIALKSAPFLMGGIALVTTLVGLIVTNLVTQGVSIQGLNAWIVGTLVVWLFSVLGSVILPLFLFKSILGKDKNSSSPPPPAAS